MKISAVVCEFSPFHYGHEYLLKETKKESDAVIAIMSGGFTERGEPAITSKYNRAKMALAGGADLVLELPFPFSCAGTEKFAMGGIDIADALGCVNEVVCGTECDDASEITHAAANILSPKFNNELANSKGKLRTGSYGTLYFDTYKRLFGETDIFDGSNNILAIAYAKRLIQNGSKIQLRTVRRTGKSFNGEGTGFESGSSLRKMILSGKDFSEFVPGYSADVLREAVNEGDIYDFENLFSPLSAIFHLTDTSEYIDMSEMNDELYNRIKSAFDTSKTMKEVLESSKTVQYSMSKIRRAIIFAVLGVSGWDLGKVSFTQVLGANETGREILKNIKNKCKIEIVTKPADCKLPQYEKSKKADALLMLSRQKILDANAFVTSSPIMI